MNWRGSITVQDKIFASLPYLLPLFYSLEFGEPLLRQFPVLGIILVPLIPVQFIYSTIPLAGLIIFFVLFLLVVRNERIAHFIRFNAMQAILLQIVLLLCSLAWDFVLQRILGFNLVTQTLFNIIFLGTVVACGYSVVQSLIGRYAEIPALSEAAYAQVR